MDKMYFGAGRLVLVVDDQPDFCEAMQHLVATLGFRAVCAGNGIDALAKLEHETPSLVLLDLFMPFMDGIDFMRQVRARKRNPPPIIAVTGDVRAAAIAVGSAAQSLGAKAILLKPFTREQLAKVINYALEEPATASA